jgi:hypothetical protein
VLPECGSEALPMHEKRRKIASSLPISLLLGWGLWSNAMDLVNLLVEGCNQLIILNLDLGT